MDHSLEVYSDNNMIFHSDKHWLHPLFELEQFLKNKNYNSTELLVKDKIIGKAAALLLSYLGIGAVQAELMSELGKEVLERYDIKYEYERLVDRIICATEEILKKEFDPQKAYVLLKKRAGNTT